MRMHHPEDGHLMGLIKIVKKATAKTEAVKKAADEIRKSQNPNRGIATQTAIDVEAVNRKKRNG